MSRHFDLYSALHLSPDADSRVLISEIDGRIRSLQGTEGAVLDELRVARLVLGDPWRRRLYDRRLTAPEAPDITIGAVTELASLPPSSPHPPDRLRSGAPTTPAPMSSAVTGSPGSGPRPWLVGGSVSVAVVAAVIAVVIAVTASPGGGESSALQGTADSSLSVSDSEESLSGFRIVEVRSGYHEHDRAICDGDPCDRIVMELDSESELKITPSMSGNREMTFTVTGDGLDAAYRPDISLTSQGHVSDIRIDTAGQETMEMTVDTDGMLATTTLTSADNPRRYIIDIRR